jgi:hypothetical protein
MAPSKAARFDIPDDDDYSAPNDQRSEEDDEPQTPTFSELRRNLSFATLQKLEMKEIHSAVWRKAGGGEGKKVSSRMTYPASRWFYNFTLTLLSPSRFPCRRSRKIWSKY